MSHAQHIAQDLAATKRDIAKQARVSDAQYSECMFETGCRFIETFAREFVPQRQAIIQGLTYNMDWGFWDWWRVKWSLDDIAIIQQYQADRLPEGRIDTPSGYVELKEYMIGDPLLHKELYHMINDKI